ncbi:hypothetical protein SADUNF_Sadunf04G0093300 [Salix dunnii]|uniref:Uncharacterized protein n=1 Tax=Salix dunnii TaxID=1413687 RepID=A0A835N2U5_9ROSI|nr:hypothetical protein SADUNF_Sadunf04G0093300 [Salix dunnii]
MDSRIGVFITPFQANTGVYYWELNNPIFISTDRSWTNDLITNHLGFQTTSYFYCALEQVPPDVSLYNVVVHGMCLGGKLLHQLDQ